MSNSLGFLFPVFLEKFKRLLKGKATQNASDKPRERERERERDTQRDHHGVRIHDQRVLREDREDRPGDVREGVQSERTSDGETGGVEEDAIGGELFFFKSRSALVFCVPRGKDPPMHTLVFFGCARRARECFGPTAGARKRGERGDAHRVRSRSRSRALSTRRWFFYTYRTRSMMFVIFGRGETIISFLKMSHPRYLSRAPRARQMEEEGVPSTALREVSLLQMLSESAFIVRLLKVEHVEEDGKAMLYLVFEYLNQDLKHFMDETGRGPANPLPKATVQNFMYQLLLGTAHLHKHGVMHRDLKPQNLLVDKANNVLKIADLGLGRAFSVPVKSYTHEIVTLWYRAPEVLLGGSHYSTPVDIWSIGCIFAEMARKQPLFPGDSELQQLLHIFKLLGTPNETVWPGVTKLRDWHEFPQWKPQDLAKIVPQLDENGIDLLQQMLEFDPAKRIHATEALEHPYFADLEKTQFAEIEEQFEKENRVSVNAQ